MSYPEQQQARHAGRHGLATVTGERLTALHQDTQTIAVYNAHGAQLDTFNLADWRQILADGVRMPDALRINW